MTAALGACQEYNSFNNATLPITGDSPFVSLSNSGLCVSSSGGYIFWLNFLANVLFLLFLVRLKVKSLRWVCPKRSYQNQKLEPSVFPNAATREKWARSPQLEHPFPNEGRFRTVPRRLLCSYFEWSILGTLRLDRKPS